MRSLDGHDQNLKPVKHAEDVLKGFRIISQTYMSFVEYEEIHLIFRCAGLVLKLRLKPKYGSNESLKQLQTNSCSLHPYHNQRQVLNLPKI